ncbi:MAG: NAD-binding protein [Sulfurimonas sp.]|uniref:NAD-binding protein n=1 Tax=Sulfurimonas sp. TaxID=2022749 RepID=UPI0028CD50DD|nr:NAD-binding protein [Sulfurimonas sp.]MDT8338795.1 NAD-binding protein [Sulfurimonas sp.]
MDIIIAGAGRVGFRLAKSLSENNNVIIMDKNEDALEKLQESIDVLTIPGDVQDPKSYKSLENRSIDIFIAVTDNDEINLISSIIASEKIDVKRKIIRLKKEFFARSSIATKIGITDAVFPYNLTAKSLVSLLDYPMANNVKSFAQTSNKLISIKIESDIQELSVFKIDNDKAKVVGIDSGKRLYIPNGDERLKIGDMIYLFGEDDAIEKISKNLNKTMPKKIKNVVIFGADILGIEIAKALIEKKAVIKIIEKDIQKCKTASEILQNRATIINSKYGDFRLYDDEGLKNADMIIASTSNDEENIIKCIEAKEQGVQKVVAINNDLEHYNLMHSLGIIVVRGPKINAFYSIMETIGSSSVINTKLFCGGSGICFIKELKDGKRVISPLNITGAITYIVSNDQLHIFHKKQIFEHPAIVAVFCLEQKREEVRKWINKL